MTREMTRSARGLVGGVLWVLGGQLSGCTADKSAYAGPPTLLLVALDTLRVDVAASSMPTLSALRAGGLDWPHMMATGSWTYHTMPSLLSGRPMMDFGAAVYAPGVRHIPDEVELLAEILGDRGYHTFYSVANPMAGATPNLLQGYDEVETPWSMAGHLRALDRWLNTWNDEGRAWPFFIHLHAMEPHAPYGEHLDPRCEVSARAAAASCEAASGFDLVTTDNIDANDLSEGWSAEAQSLCASASDLLYRCVLQRLDSDLGQIRDTLDQHGAAEPTLLVLASDHGEALGPMVYGHNNVQCWALTQGFASFIGAGITPGSVTGAVSQVEVVPTILDQLGIQDVEGLAPSLFGEERAPRRSFWCAADGRRSFGYIDDLALSYHRLDLTVSGEAVWWTTDPTRQDEVVVDVAQVPEAARLAIEAEQAATRGYCE